MTRCIRFSLLLPTVLLAALAMPSQAQAQSQPQQQPQQPAGAVYRCPGPPVLYTDALSPNEARERGCRSIEGAPITVIQAPKPRATAANASAPGAAGGPTPRAADAKVEPAAQRQRDSDARRILDIELRREEDKLAALRRDFNNGEPERRGDERNYQRYLDRVADMKAGILRSESDIAALKRELGKLPP